MLRIKREETAHALGSGSKRLEECQGGLRGPLKIARDRRIPSLIQLPGKLIGSEEYYETFCRKSVVLGGALKAKADEAAMHGQAFCWTDAEQFLWGGTGDQRVGALPEFSLPTSREREKQIRLLKVRVINHLAAHGWTPWGFGGRYDNLISVLSRPGAAQLQSLFEQEHFEKFGERVQYLILRREAATSRRGIPWSSVVEDVLGGKAYFKSRFNVVGDRKLKQDRELRIVIRDRLYRGGWLQKVEAEGCCTIGSYGVDAVQAS